VVIVGITLREVTRANGTTKIASQSASSEKADAKGTATQRAHDEFIERLEGYLTTGEEGIGMSFTKIIKDMYPDSSKKRIRGSRE
jgi:hypothetical protein